MFTLLKEGRIIVERTDLIKVRSNTESLVKKLAEVQDKANQGK